MNEEAVIVMRMILLSTLVVFLSFTATLSVAVGSSHEPLDRKGLGLEVCKGLGEYCMKGWTMEMDRGGSYNQLIHWICTVVWNREGDQKAIDCIENGIRGAERMTPAALVIGQFKSGEREDHPRWASGSDREWANLAKTMARKVPPYCDQHTPVIFNYFACISYEVLNLTRRMKKATE